MKLEQQVVSLPIAQRLKELGVKQLSAFSWICRNFEDKENGIKERWDIVYGVSPEGSECSAFTVAELGEMLPGSVKAPHSGNPDSASVFYFEEWKGIFDYTVQYKGLNKVLHWITEKSEAEARGKMLIYLIENGLIKLEK